MPLAGSMLTATPMLMKAWNAVTMARPAPASCEKAVALAGGAQQQTDRQKAEQGRDHGAEDEAEFLAGDGEDEVGMRFGDAVLDRAGARADAGQAAMREGLQRQAGLVAGVGRVEELIDAVMDMRKQKIGQTAEQRRAAAEKPHPEQRNAGEEQQRGPQRQQKRRLADIGLQSEE